MYRLFFYAFGTYHYSHSVSATHTRTIDLYFPTLQEMMKWEQEQIKEIE